MSKAFDLTGQKHNKLTAIKRVKNNGRYTMWLFKCDCGNEITTRTNSVLRGNTKSCGCLKKDKVPHITHGMSKTRLYEIYSGMKRRCCNQSDSNFKDYGLRGIKLCDEWLKNRKLFFEWALKNGYKDDLTIERIDNNKGYSPDNCRWATPMEQQHNTRRNVFATINGITKTITEWSRDYHIDYHQVFSRIRRGWSPVKAVTTPKLKHGRPRKNH